MKRKEWSLDEAQFYLAKDAILHPRLNNQFNNKLIELSAKGYICLMPCTILQNFYDRLTKKVS